MEQLTEFYKIILDSDNNIALGQEITDMTFSLNTFNVPFEGKCLLSIEEFHVDETTIANPFVIYVDCGQPYSYDTRTRGNSSQIMYVPHHAAVPIHIKKTYQYDNSIITNWPFKSISLRLRNLDGSKLGNDDLNNVLIKLHIYPIKQI
jgi:hypothetical protein